MMNYIVKTVQHLDDEVVETEWAEVATLDLARVLKEHIKLAAAEEFEFIYSPHFPEVQILRLDSTIVENDT